MAKERQKECWGPKAPFLGDEFERRHVFIWAYREFRLAENEAAMPGEAESILIGLMGPCSDKD